MFHREILRFLRRNRLLSLCGTSILTLGIGASALALTFLLTFASLSYPGIRPDVTATVAEETNGGGSAPITFERFERLRRSVPEVTRVAVYSRLLQADPGSSIAAVSSGFFSIFTAPLAAGRDFTPIEEGQTGHRAVILSFRVAERQFGSPASAVGQNVTLRGSPFSVVGVAPGSFEGMFGETPEFWVPASAIFPLLFDGASDSSWKFVNLFYAAATTNGRSAAQLTNVLHGALPPSVGDEPHLHVSPGLTQDPVRDERIRVRLRLGLALSVVFTLVSGLNLAWLLLAQAPRRIAETRIKMALGADRTRLIGEGMVGPGAIILMGFFGAGIVLAAGMTVIENWTGIVGQAARGAWGTALLAYGMQLPFLVVLAALVVFLPMLGLFQNGRSLRPVSGGSGPTVNAIMNVPVILQVAMTAATCVLAGMIVSTLITEMNESLGFSPLQLTAVSIGPESGTLEAHWSGDEVSPVMRALPGLIAHAESIAGIRAAAYGHVPVSDEGGTPLSIQRTDSALSTRLTVQEVTVSPGYFRTVGARLVAGRDFSGLGGGDEVVLNQTAARALWLNQRAVNRTIRITVPMFSGLPSSSYSAIVVGVVADMRPPGYGRHAAPTIYQSMYHNGIVDFGPQLILHGVVSPSAVEAALAQEVQARLPGMKILSVYNLRSRVKKAFEKTATRAYLAMSGAFTMALISSIGLYAALTYFVRSRRRELAIRVCLGASNRSIRRIVYGRAIRSTGLGALVSLLLWPLLASLSSAEYLGAVSWSTGRAISISAACVAISVAIALLPGREATLIPPSQLLKEE